MITREEADAVILDFAGPDDGQEQWSCEEVAAAIALKSFFYEDKGLKETARMTLQKVVMVANPSFDSTGIEQMAETPQAFYCLLELLLEGLRCGNWEGKQLIC